MRPGFNPWVGKIPWRREWLPTPVIWPGEFHGLYSPWGRKELDTAECLSLCTSPLTILSEVRTVLACIYSIKCCLLLIALKLTLNNHYFPQQWNSCIHSLYLLWQAVFKVFYWDSTLYNNKYVCIQLRQNYTMFLDQLYRICFRILSYSVWSLIVICVAVVSQLPSCVWPFCNPCTVAHQILCPWDFPGSNTEVGCLFLL